MKKKHQSSGKKALGAALAVVLWLTAVLWLASCATAPPPVEDRHEDVARADRLFADRQYGAAAKLYESALAEDPPSDADRLLFHLAMIHALRESPLHEPARSRQLLNDLIEYYPAGAWRDQAFFLLELEGRLEKAHGDLAAERAAAARLEELLAESATDAEAMHRCLVNLGREVKQKTDLSAEIERLTDELERCREQVEKLKAIDLEKPP